MKILHFEYSSFFAKVIKDMVERMGYSVIQTKNGSDLFKILSTEDVYVIITGLELADMSAKQMINDLHSSRYSQVPVIVITSNDMEEANAKLEGVSVKDIIVKQDMTFESFYQAVDDALDI